MKKLLILIIVPVLIFSSCGKQAVDNSTLTDVENYLMGKRLLEGEKTEVMAEMIGATNGFKYVNSKIEVYEYDTKSKVYKGLVKTNKVTLEGFGTELSVSAVNGKYVLLYSGDDESTIDAFKEFDHKEAPIVAPKETNNTQEKVSSLSTEGQTQKTTPTPTLAPEPTIEPTVKPTIEPIPTLTTEPTEPTKTPTPTPKPEEPEADYFDWVLFQTDDYNLVREGILNGEAIYIEDGYYMVSPAYYDNVLEPYMDSIIMWEKDYTDTIPEREHTLVPDAEYEVIEEESDYDEEALQERIQDMIDNNKASSEH